MLRGRGAKKIDVGKAKGWKAKERGVSIDPVGGTESRHRLHIHLGARLRMLAVIRTFLKVTGGALVCKTHLWAD